MMTIMIITIRIIIKIIIIIITITITIIVIIIAIMMIIIMMKYQEQTRYIINNEANHELSVTIPKIKPTSTNTMLLLLLLSLSLSVSYSTWRTSFKEYDITKTHSNLNDLKLDPPTTWSTHAEQLMMRSMAFRYCAVS